MARERKSLPLPKVVRNSSPESVGSMGSCLNVVATTGTREYAGGSTSTSTSSTSPAQSKPSTPPTSVPEGSIPDDQSMKPTNSSSASVDKQSTTTTTTTRRRSTRRSGATSYSLDNASDPHLGATSAAAQLKGKNKDLRNFSGATLVNDAPAPGEHTTANTPHRDLKDQSDKAFDTAWALGALPGDSIATAAATRPKRRKSETLERMATAVGNLVDKGKKEVKKVLGKRTRDDSEVAESSNRRKSARLSTLSSLVHTSSDKKYERDHSAGHEVGEAVAEPSKPSRLASSFSMPELFTRPKPTPAPKLRTRAWPFKKFLDEGLYVGQHAGDKPGVKDSTNKKKRASKGLSDQDSTTGNGKLNMTLPMFGYGDRERDFVIPFDVFAPAYRVRGEQKPEWGKVNKNRLYGDARQLWKKQNINKSYTSLCFCKRNGKACGEDDDCINRSMDYECDDSNCDAGGDCENRPFTKLAERMSRTNDKKSMAFLYNSGVEVIKTVDRGFGVRATRTFEPGEIITEYIGEIITTLEAEKRIKTDYKGRTVSNKKKKNLNATSQSETKQDYYQMQFEQGMILDATKGSIARFVNHSCEPNCRMIKRNVGGEPRIGLFAGDEGVLTGDELTYDYNFDPYNTKEMQACHCGSAKCRGFLGPRPPKSKADKEAVAAILQEHASSPKRKADEAGLLDTVDPAMFKKRKLPKFSKGWAYVDEDLEKQRREEEELDRKLRALQRVGVVEKTVRIDRPSYTEAAKGKKGIRAQLSSIKGSLKRKGRAEPDDDEVQERPSSKNSFSNYVSTTLGRKSSKGKELDRASTSLSKADKRKSTASTMSYSTKRQSTLSFARPGALADENESQETLLKRQLSTSSRVSKKTTASGKTTASAKATTTVRRSLGGGSSSKRASTVRLIEDDD